MTVDDNTGAILTGSTEGTATITASFAGNETYKPSTASYIIKVVDPNKIEVDFDFSNPVAYGYTKPASSKYTTLAVNDKIKSGIVTITNVKGGTTATRFYNSSNTIDLRIYTNAELTVSVPDGYLIKSIDITGKSVSSDYKIGGQTPASSDTKWHGSAQSIAIDNITSTLQLSTMKVGYVAVPLPAASTLTLVAQSDELYYATYSNLDNSVQITAENDDNIVGVNAVTIENGKMELNALDGGKVAKGEGVLIVSMKPTVTVTPIAGEVTASENNNLVATPAEEGVFAAEDGYKYYRMAYNNAATKTGLGFYYGEANGSAFKVTPGKAYLRVLDDATAAAKGFSFNFSEATGLRGVTTVEPQSNAVFNLQGQRVNANAKGLLIKNGKKYLAK